MTLSELQDRLLRRVGDDPALAAGGYYTAGEAAKWLNTAQNWLVLRTLCLETTATFSLLTDGTAFYSMLETFSDWLLPLRVRVTGGGKVRPKRLSDLAALDATWSTTPGAPIHYAHLGFDFMAIYKQPARPTSLDITYARGPVPMVSASDSPEIPVEYHPELINGAEALMRMKEGGQEFQKVLGKFQSFTDAGDKLAGYVRARNQEQGYDYYPIELVRFDRSKMISVEASPNV